MWAEVEEKAVPVPINQKELLTIYGALRDHNSKEPFFVEFLKVIL